MMDYGGAPNAFPDLNDPDYRYELYSDWKEVSKYLPSFGIHKFCQNKGISLQKLEEIIEEFEKPLKNNF